MGKTFYTERDIEDMAARGVTAIDIDDNVVLTDLARDKAIGLGLRLVRHTPGNSAPSGGVNGKTELAAKVKAAVMARLGKDVDPALVEAVVSRVVAHLK